jgi:GDSL-like Lipase/Acylhydrolase family
MSLGGRVEARDAMKNVVLLGDSVFDNGAYVGQDTDVLRQLRQLLAPGWKAVLNARDGAVISDMEAQLGKLPSGATHLVLSVGGNDALRQSGTLDASVDSVAGALTMLNLVRENFRTSYATMLDKVSSLKIPTAVCTIYDPRYPDLTRRKIAAAALALLNDAITREAFARSLTLIDLRLVCDQDADFANPIEPSSEGGEKIARAIFRFLNGEHDASLIV